MDEYKFLRSPTDPDDLISEIQDLDERVNEWAERGYSLDNILNIQHEGTTVLVVAIMAKKTSKKKGKKEGEKNIRGVFWGASSLEIKNSEKWRLQDENSRQIFYKGSIGRHRCDLSYHFGDDGKLVSVEYYFRVTAGSDVDEQKTKTVELHDWLEKILIENYGDKAENYTDRPIWVVHDGETVIELEQIHSDQGGIYAAAVIMTCNRHLRLGSRIDHHKQALEEI